MVLHQHVGEYVVATFQYHPLLEIVKGGFLRIKINLEVKIINNIQKCLLSAVKIHRKSRYQLLTF